MPRHTATVCPCFLWCFIANRQERLRPQPHPQGAVKSSTSAPMIRRIMFPRRRGQRPVSDCWYQELPFVRNIQVIISAVFVHGSCAPLWEMKRRLIYICLYATRDPLHSVDLTAKTRVEMPQLVPRTQHGSGLCNPEHALGSQQGDLLFEFGVSDLGGSELLHGTASEHQMRGGGRCFLAAPSVRNITYR